MEEDEHNEISEERNRVELDLLSPAVQKVDKNKTAEEYAVAMMSQF